MGRRDEEEQEKQIAKSVISSLSDDTLLKASEFLNNLSEKKRIQKLYDTYVEGVKQSLKNTGNGKIYVKYDIGATVTGRLSNSGVNVKRGGGKETKLGPSFHTFPREQEDFNIRNIIVTNPGWDFIAADEKAMELRILAHVANEKNLIKAFESGHDLHEYSAHMVYEKKLEDVTKEERQASKEASFLVIYGGTALTLAAKRGISERAAQKILDSWFSTYPGVKSYMHTVREYLEEFGYIKTIFGRRRNLPNIKSPVKSIRERAFRQALNFTIQSPANDFLCGGLVGIHNKMKAHKMAGKIIGTVHDSIEIGCPKKETPTIIKFLVEELVNYEYLKKYFGLQMRVPLDIDVEIGTSFGNGKHVDISTYYP